MTRSTILTTASGRMVDLLAPTVDDIDFDDICQQLSKENRYNGATPDHCYSVAEHLSRGALLVLEQTGEPLAAGYFLLHDMPEAYLKDDTTPKKRALDAVAEAQFGVLAGAITGAFASLTERFDKVIAERAGLPWPAPPEIEAIVHRYDRIMLNTEWRDLMPVPHPWPIESGEEPVAGMTIKPWAWQRALVELRHRCSFWLPSLREVPFG